MKLSCCFSVLLLVAAGNSIIVPEKDLEGGPSLGTDQSNPGQSCRHIYESNPSSHEKSGSYWIKLTTSETVLVYCDMGSSGQGGGWTKIADVAGSDCPPGWQSITIPTTEERVCRGSGEDSGCSSANFSVRGHIFNKIYGYALGYQKGRSLGFSSYYSSAHNIDEHYLDGLSITLGNPRQHIWSYGAGISKTSYINKAYNCPCSSFNNEAAPNFVRDHYYCESGASNNPSRSDYITDNVLWDGKDCAEGNSCCAQLQMPYFIRILPFPINGTIDYVEARICQDSSFDYGSALIKEMQLFITYDP